MQPRQERILYSPKWDPGLLRFCDYSTNGTTPALLVGHPMIYERFELRAQVYHMEGLLADDRRCLMS
jgi:hypothetical protein